MKIDQHSPYILYDFIMDAVLYFALTGHTPIVTSHYTSLQSEIRETVNSKIRGRSPLHFTDLVVECLELFSTLPGVWLDTYTYYYLVIRSSFMSSLAMTIHKGYGINERGSAECAERLNNVQKCSN